MFLFIGLLNLLVNGHLLEDRIVLLQLKTTRSVLTVLGSDVTACTGQATILHFGALKNHLDSVAFCFLCHCLIVLLRLSLVVSILVAFGNHSDVLPVEISFGNGLLQCGIKSDLVNHTEAGS